MAETSKYPRLHGAAFDDESWHVGLRGTPEQQHNVFTPNEMLVPRGVNMGRDEWECV